MSKLEFVRGLLLSAKNERYITIIRPEGFDFDSGMGIALYENQANFRVSPRKETISLDTLNQLMSDVLTPELETALKPERINFSRIWNHDVKLGKLKFCEDKVPSTDHEEEIGQHIAASEEPDRVTWVHFYPTKGMALDLLEGRLREKDLCDKTLGKYWKLSPDYESFYRRVLKKCPGIKRFYV
jgi:hypothetical protein